MSSAPPAVAEPGVGPSAGPCAPFSRRRWRRRLDAGRAHALVDKHPRRRGSSSRSGGCRGDSTPQRRTSSAQAELALRAAVGAERRAAPSLAATAYLSLCDAQVHQGNLRRRRRRLRTGPRGGSRRAASDEASRAPRVSWAPSTIAAAGSRTPPRRFGQALGVYREIGDRAGEAAALNRLAATALSGRRPRTRRRSISRGASASIARSAIASGEAKALNNLGIVLRDGGDLDAAVTLFENSLSDQARARQPARYRLLAPQSWGSCWRLRGDVDGAASVRCGRRSRSSKTSGIGRPSRPRYLSLARARASIRR